jgi:hypothetical protein
MPEETAVRPQRRNYAVLLALLFVVLALETLSTRSVGHQIFSDVIRTVMAIAIWVAVFRRPRERVAMAALLIIIVGVSWARYVETPQFDQAVSVASQGTLGVFLWFAVYVILRDLFRKPAPGAENVLGAICGYLIAGYAWSRVNAVAYLLVPSAYRGHGNVARLARTGSAVHYYTFARC